jgi:hypothetical protein
MLFVYSSRDFSTIPLYSLIININIYSTLSLLCHLSAVVFSTVLNYFQWLFVIYCLSDHFHHQSTILKIETERLSLMLHIEDICMCHDGSNKLTQTDGRQKFYNTL